MIWNGTDPLQPDHEVAYRGRPTKRVTILKIDQHPVYPVCVEYLDGASSAHRSDGRYYHDALECPFDLIPLQQEPAK